MGGIGMEDTEGMRERVRGRCTLHLCTWLWTREERILRKISNILSFLGVKECAFSLEYELQIA